MLTSQKKVRVYVRRCESENNGIPSELLDIQDYWRQLATNYGDEGTCVIGASMNFTYKGTLYKMPPLSPWQGATSWEHCKNEIIEMLSFIGATEIRYNPGMMD
ncbi:MULTISPECIES: hypothetical protein [Bacillus subtilis group]|uniref:hypothetical protein n=1 Tax=Bacillus subtilis group TaxID=653685 RepID=UPI0011A317B4|nr:MULTISPECIES: hypothetical protein [Bacillus subtilis group]MEC2191678.1 hypothetical protein [Bacillus spizizenii]MEC2297478.1 hypothetical protein [Bacillus subtilis]MEC2400524.1 hypothetical protein [Bacillus subtilis]MED4660884.1 hypothetical protein [Bacillus subtilis]MED4667797.1 hypothetical protein [Bacillus subtilis]